MIDSGHGVSDRLIVVWDAWTRLFHWSLAAAVIFQIFSGRSGELFFDWHRYVGEFVLALIVFRLVWGLVGSNNIRLTRLLASPHAVIQHLCDLVSKRSTPERGHNAAGSWAVLLMLAITGVQAVTGLFIADEDELLEGALYGSVSADLGVILLRIHKFNADLILLVVGIHVVMVAVYLLYAGQNLVRPMVTGRMSWPGQTALPELLVRKSGVGAMCAVLSAALVGWLCGWYPV